MENIALYGSTAFGVAVVGLLVSGFKDAGIPTKYLPLISIAIGILYGIGLSFVLSTSIEFGVFWGLFIAVSTSTGYDAISGFTSKSKAVTATDAYTYLNNISKAQKNTKR